ncbi:Phthiocerol/phenolphthiocerol synthesis polyketide synthase type I PpsC [Mycobacterium attenuatum]|uniref:Phthiocerol/phenolphthiocerol synthesis polyketide synthase type I PpsC n=1 Tax=Mycobacterium attenuatum TaxID=2341086 RepID=A0A498QE89_9MYCO|nr:type I polyketide synthase [Mycobacterium attenuatum]VBA41960.1 Phthiocerol/phenolphthiocerol synthesis polyketide synthase type I PpsC [Mycobacterium attenuatum]
MTATFTDGVELRKWLIGYVVANIDCSPDEIDPDLSLKDLGLGSRDVINMSGELAKLLGRAVSPVDCWQHPTINALVAFLTAPEPDSGAEETHSAHPRVSEPIAVIGMGCRFPGEISEPEALWRFLWEGHCAIGEVPAERWRPFDDGSPEVSATLARTTRWGSFLGDIDGFDAEFFEISPSEAAKMDPQQRLLLEVAWEALEHAGIPATSLRRSQTGVFAGACGSEYGYLAAADLPAVDAWNNTGGALSIIANRLSYFLDLRGPSVAVDTACSSSLVAIHLACQSLRMGDSDLAIAAGVNLLLAPAVFHGFDQAGVLSQSGLCHAFDAAADGFVRGEGCGVVVLKRLSNALHDGDRVLAVVRGSAVNQDGRSNGLMAPNPAAQMAVLRAAYANAGVQPREVDYVEAHGTGTLLGDPIEARALGKVLGRGRAATSPLLIGAVKTNLGHLEAAAGITGFIKAVLAVQRGQIPASLHFENPNPHIPFDQLRLKVVAEQQEWPAVARARRAGVSSFGFGGTNAHVVLEQAPEPAAPVGDPVPAMSTLVVSGKTPERIASAAGVLAEWMAGAGAEVEVAEVAHTLAHHRVRHPLVATVCARERAQALVGLQALAAGRAATGVVGPHEGECGPGTVFVYSGQGSQWAGMGQQLLTDEPAFAAAVAELEPSFVEQVGFSLQQVLAEGQPVAGDARVQPVIVGLQLALTRLWRVYGVEPDAVIGHSMGEVSAAVVAGALTPAEGLRVIAIRSRLMARMAGQGAVALLELDADAAARLLHTLPGVSVAGLLSPRQTVIAGPPAQVAAAITAVQQQNRFARRVNMQVASHTASMDPILAELRSALAGLAPKLPVIPLLSTVTDTGTPRLDADYWVANVRQPVRLSQAVAAAGQDHTTFVEISPHPVLTQAITETLGTATHHHSIGTLRRDADDTLSFHTNLNAATTNHPPRMPHPPGPHQVLPAAPWRHRRHWISAKPTAAAAVAGHPLLGTGVTDPTTGIRVWERTLGPDSLWLDHHRIDGACVLPGAAYVELALAAATEAFGAEVDRPWAVAELLLHQLMPIREGTVVVTRLSGAASGPSVEIRSGSADSGWTLHASAALERLAATAAEPIDVDESSVTMLDADDLYRRLRSAGQQHGPAFQGVVGLRVFGCGAARAEVRLPVQASQGARRFLAHPVMLDVAVQALGATRLATELAGAGDAGTVAVPARFSGVRVYGDVTEGVTALAVLRPTPDPDRFVGRVVLSGAQGQTLMVIDEIDMAVLRVAAETALASHAFDLRWEPIDSGHPAAETGPVLLVDEQGVGNRGSDELWEAVCAGLSRRASRYRVVRARDQAGLLDALTHESWHAVVLVCPPRSADEALADGEQLELAQSRTLFVAGMVKTLSQRDVGSGPRLWIVTRGAQQVSFGESVTLAQGTLRGIARVLAFEHPELATTIIDVEAEGSGSAGALVDELCAESSHDEVALRDGQRYVHRLVPVAVSAQGEFPVERRPVRVDLDSGGAVRLQIDQPGRLDALAVHAMRHVPPAADQVEIRVVAAGVSAGDVLKATGGYPTGADGAAVLGSECVGYVTRLGAAVDSVRIGQRVIAFGPGTVASHVTTSADFVVPAPEALSDHEAAAVGIAYLTAWHGLCEVGRLSAGERVLIHSAAGDVGLAALWIAKATGARIYATASSAVQRKMLAQLDVEYVGDSSSREFADEIRVATDGQGVDVILNSLAGEAIRRGLQMLAPGGRFVDLGRSDVCADAQLGLALLARSASFAVVDLDLNLRLRPRRYRELLQKLLHQLVAGQLRMLPVTAFSLDHAVDAFELMASDAHVGKVVISMPSTGRIAALAQPPAQPLVRRDGGYIVVGGMGGLGLVVARWLVAQGAGLVVLNGRSVPNADVGAAIAAMNAAGIRVQVITGDIAQPDTAARLVAAVEQAGARPAGVVHSAMVLADEIVSNMSESAAQRVFAPKVAGHWWLHTATAHLDLDWWLSFSSAASMLGSPGQGAYAAANSWVDGLVAYRRAHGLPAIGINWGPWAQVGRAQFLADRGLSMLRPELGLAAMQQLLIADRGRTGVFSLDAGEWFRSFPAAQASSLFAGLADTSVGETSLIDTLRRADRQQRRRLLESYLCELAASKLGLTPSRLDTQAALDRLGIDSLTALTLRNQIQHDLGIAVPAVQLLDGGSIAGLTDWLAEQLCGAGPDQPDPVAAVDSAAQPNEDATDDVAGSPWIDLLTQVPQVSDDDVDELLRQLIAAKGEPG